MVFCHSVYSVISDLMIAEPLSKTWLRLDFEMPSIVRWSLESAVTFSFKKRDLVAPKWQNLFIKNHFVYYYSSKTGFFSLQVTKSQPMMHNINCHLFRNVSQAVYFCLVNNFIKQWMTSPKIKTQGSTKMTNRVYFKQLKLLSWHKLNIGWLDYYWPICRP